MDVSMPSFGNLADFEGLSSHDQHDEKNTSVLATHLRQSQLLHREKRFKEAEEVWQKMLEDLPLNEKDKAVALNERGLAKYMQVDFPGACQDYTEALQLDSSLAAARYNRGTVHYRMGRFKAAEDDFAAACQAQPNNPEFAEGLMRCRESLSESKMS